MGRKLETTSCDEVADAALEGVLNDSYYILPWNDEGRKRFRDRNEGVLEGKNPEPRF